MDDNQKKIDQLLSRLESIVRQQENFTQEINSLRDELNHLKGTKKSEAPEAELTSIEADKPKEKASGTSDIQDILKSHKFESSLQSKDKKKTGKRRRFTIKTDLEKFIGENLINKIGIAITIIGVGIGVKYSIDHDLVTPLVRVISGYVTGIVLLLVGIRLKANYTHYSAVLVSGAMAIMYFITFAAYSFYELLPVTVSFGVMVIFTVFTVLASINYNQQVIAIIGMVGAYAVPFLLSDDSGDVKVLLSYVSVINVGILAVAVLRYWKALYFSSFILSWIIFGFWYTEGFRLKEHFGIALVFSAIFFLIFYATLLSYKLIKREKFNSGDIVLLVLNSFVFYGIGYVTLVRHETGKELLGLFTLVNALLHFIVCVIVFRQRMSDRSLFFLIAGMVLVFITMAIPVQLDGNWVTLLWIGEALVLFWIGRTRAEPTYEFLAYPLILFAFISLLHDWSLVYGHELPNDPNVMMIPVFNIQFLSSSLFISCLGAILYLFTNAKYKAPKMLNIFKDLLQYFVPVLFIFSLFFAIRNEIANYWDQLLALSEIEISSDDPSQTIRNYSLEDFKTIWIVNYALLFFTAMTLLNIYKLRNGQLAKLNLLANSFVMLVFLTVGLYVLSELREAYLSQFQGEYYEKGVFYLIIRYVSFVFVAGLIGASYQSLNQKLLQSNNRRTFDLLFHTSMLWILSSELIHWLDIYGTYEAYKLGLSILWGAYALSLIILGIWKHKKHLRIMAIVVFGLTLIKLFAYDVSHLKTLPKTILFVSLGIFLLIISFLYNKYKHIITDDGKA